MTKKKASASPVRSSAVEYLTFIAATGKGGVEAVYSDEDIWLSQKMMAALYDVDVRTANYHLKKIFTDGELEESSVIRKFRITATDSKAYETQHYNLGAQIHERRFRESAAGRTVPRLPDAGREVEDRGAL